MNVEVCPNCGLGAYAYDDLIGRHCSFCGHYWPYPEVY